MTGLVTCELIDPLLGKQGYYSFAQKYLKNLFLTLAFTFCSTIFKDAPWESIVQLEQSIRKIAQMELIQI